MQAVYQTTSRETMLHEILHLRAVHLVSQHRMITKEISLHLSMNSNSLKHMAMQENINP